ncbi:MAG: putative DNA binding domain-containing protein [Chloroflexi bacterium]|nr:putative DNA binding domain-containing protein [Chloroflexota bacterium]
MAQRKQRDAAEPQRAPAWRRMDVHLHTPASSDFQEAGITFLDLLTKAEARGLDIIAFTDHNSVAGYARMLREVEQWEWLEKTKRITAEEKLRLDNYRRLRQKILVLPGFEFTATFGFHILGVFSDKTPLRVIEHVLLNLNVPPEKLDLGATDMGASADVLTAYRLIDEAGGLAIAAHVNSSHGVAMRGIDFGGQTKIAYTQDSHLHALEVTDLDSRSKRNTASFFNGSKPEYPRRMHCIQSSDSHRLNRDPRNPKNLGAFERMTEVFLETVSFDALRAVLRGNDFTLTRPFRGKAEVPVDAVRAAREAGASIVQAFHDSFSVRGTKLRAIVADICAFANTNGGTIFVGATADVRKAPAGISNPKPAMEAILTAVQTTITPPLDVTFAVHEVDGIKVLQINVPRGEDVPYAIDDNQIYLRTETETNLAVRDEIVQLIQRRFKPAAVIEPPPVKNKKPQGRAPQPAPTQPPVKQPPAKQPQQAGRHRPGKSQPQPQRSTTSAAAKPIEPAATPAPIESAAPNGSTTKPDNSRAPRTGVEIVESEQRNGQFYHTVRDLRHGGLVRNVTRKSARKLWHYAISQHEQHPDDTLQIKWLGDLGLISASQRAGATRYDLALRQPDGALRIFYGVTDDGVHGEWQQVIALAEPVVVEADKSGDTD